MRSTVIVFTGLPGTGKTTLSRQIAKALKITLVAKDDIKEIMFDNIGWSDKIFSAKLARATLEIMNYIAEQHLKNTGVIVLESNYSPNLASKRFQEWQRVYDCEIIQVVCRTDMTVLTRRYFERQEKDRHPGHKDINTLEDCEINFQNRIDNGEDQPLNVTGPIKIVDTTDLTNINAKDIENWVKRQTYNQQ